MNENFSMNEDTEFLLDEVRTENGNVQQVFADDVSNSIA